METIEQLREKLYAECGIWWLDYYYEKLNEMDNDSYAICECYNKFIVNG